MTGKMRSIFDHGTADARYAERTMCPWGYPFTFDGKGNRRCLACRRVKRRAKERGVDLTPAQFRDEHR